MLLAHDLPTLMHKNWVYKHHTVCIIKCRRGKSYEMFPDNILPHNLNGKY